MDGLLPLHQAAEAGDASLCARILDDASESAKELVDRVDQNGASALMMACTRADRLEIVSLLLRRGARVNLRRHYGLYTALHSCCARGFTEVARMLLAGGNVDVDAVDAIGSTALSLACANGHLACATLLVEVGHANASLADVNGCSPLHQTMDLSVCLMLIQKGGASPLQRDYKGKTATDLFSKGSRGFGRDGCPAMRRLRADTLSRAFRLEDNWRRRKAFFCAMSALGFTRPAPSPADTGDEAVGRVLSGGTVKERRWLLLLEKVFGDMAFRELVASFL